MGAFLKQALTLIAGQMAGSNHKAAFIVKTLRATYIVSGGMVGLLWYSGYRNERVAPGTIDFPFPGLTKLKRQYSADRPEKELPSEAPASSTVAGSNTNLKGTAPSVMTLTGPLALNKGVVKAAQMSGKYPYKWGGGHAQIGVPTIGMGGGSPGTSGPPPGYDCSGAVSAVLGAMEVLKTPLTSGALASFGLPGPGNWVTIYANAVHTFMKINVNGVWRWFGTGSDKQARRGGPAWGNHDPNLNAYTVRHPPGF
jgi:hypothetical protein